MILNKSFFTEIWLLIKTLLYIIYIQKHNIIYINNQYIYKYIFDYEIHLLKISSIIIILNMISSFMTAFVFPLETIVLYRALFLFFKIEDFKWNEDNSDFCRLSVSSSEILFNLNLQTNPNDEIFYCITIFITTF